MQASTSGRDVESLDWVEGWLSAPRFASYLSATGTAHRALELYEWNSALAAAFHRDLAHLEIALRNAYDRAFCAGLGPDEPHWVFNPHRYFPVDMQRAANGQRVDANATARRQIEKAVHQARRGLSRTEAPPAGKVLAEITFGFWRYLSARRHHDRLWIPHLHRVFPSGTGRPMVDRPVGRLHDLRNRVAHHEPLLRTNLGDRHQDVLTIAELLAPELATHISATSAVPRLISERPG